MSRVGGEEGPEGAVCRVVDPGLGHGLEEIISVAEADGVSGADGRVAQGLGEKALTHASRSHEKHVLVFVEKLQGADGVQQTAIQGDRRRPVEVLQAAGLLKTGALEPEFDAPVGAAVDFVAENDLQEGCVVQLFTAGQGDALGQGGGHGAQLEPLE